MDYEKLQGKKVGPFSFEITQPHLERFNEVVCSSHSTQFPPTLMTIGQQGVFKLLEELKIPLSEVLHGEQEYEYGTAVPVAGDKVEYECEIKKVTVKGRTRKMVFLLFESSYRIPKSGDLIAISRSNVIHRPGEENA